MTTEPEPTRRDPTANLGPRLKKLGWRLFGMAVMFLVVGRIVVTAFIPDMRAKSEFPRSLLIVLVPIWSIGLLGLLLLLLGWFYTEKTEPVETDEPEEDGDAWIK